MPRKTRGRGTTPGPAVTVSKAIVSHARAFRIKRARTALLSGDFATARRVLEPLTLQRFAAEISAILDAAIAADEVSS